MVLSKVNKKLCLVIKETKINALYPWKNNNTGFRKCSRFADYTCAREICFNHQLEALPRFYVISVEFFLINLGQSQLWVCQTNQNSLNTANGRTTYLLMVGNPLPRSFDGKDFVAVKIHVKVSYFS